MDIFFNLSALALKDVAGDALQSIGGNLAGNAMGHVAGFLYNHFRDHSDRLSKALFQSTDRAWKTLELTLAGESFWERCKGLVASGDQTKFRDEMRRYLKALALPGGSDPEKFRRLCLAELKAARKEGLLGGAALDPKALADEVGAFAKYADPDGVMSAERRLLDRIAATLQEKHYENLARLLALQPRPDDSLITVAARYFLRRAIEDDPKLFQGLAFAQLGQIRESQQSQVEGLATVQAILTGQGNRLEELLGDLSADVFATFNAVLDVQAEQQRQSGQHDDVYKAVIQMQQRLDMMHTELRPRDSLSIRGDVERQLAREAVAKYRAMPEARRKELPALMNAVGKLEVATGDFHAAERDFATVVEIVDDSAAKAEAHANAHRTALERRDWEAALRELLAAAKLDPKRYEPFPLRKYRPLRILGAGGFGIAYLCRHERLGSDVVVKTLAVNDLARGITDVFAEARVLRQLEHSAIIGLRDCDYADDALTRPYLEMDYFESQTLEEFVQTNGPMPEVGVTEVARRIAEGLRAAHARGVLHRDVKPANVLVRKVENRFDVKIIDFGLAMSTERLLGSASSGTLSGSIIAGTIDYAAPEQMGRLPGVAPSFASDVYGFARTCYYALFRTPHPKAKHFDSLSPRLKRLLDDCASDDPKERPANFDDVLAGLDPVTAKPAPAVKPDATMASAGKLGQVGDKATSWFKKTFGGQGATPIPPSAPTKPKVPPPAAIPTLVLEVEPVVFARPKSPAPPPMSDGIEIVAEEVMEVLPASSTVEEALPVDVKPTSTRRRQKPG